MPLAAIAEMNSSGDWATHFDMLLHFIFQTNKTYHSEDEHNKTCEFYVLSGLEEKKKKEQVLSNDWLIQGEENQCGHLHFETSDLWGMGKIVVTRKMNNPLMESAYQRKITWSI